MKERKLSSDIGSAIISVLLCAILILCSVTLSLYYSAMYLFSGNGMSDVARFMGYSALKTEISAIGKNFNKYGVDPENADEFLNSKAVQDAAALYGEDIVAVFRGDTSTEAKFNTKNVQAAMVTNLDELVDIFTNKDMTEDEALKMESKIVATIKNDTESVVKKITTKQELTKKVKSSGMEYFLKLLFNPSACKLMLILIGIISLLIIILRYYNFGGFAWLGTSFVFSSILLLCCFIAAITGAIHYMLLGVMNLGPVTDSFVWTFAKGLCINTFLHITIFILLYVVFAKLKKRFIHKTDI